MASTQAHVSSLDSQNIKYIINEVDFAAKNQQETDRFPCIADVSMENNIQ